ncbi:MAG: hypothetical protein FJY17_00415 [Bacteroidetes bacterium]|nr:hypothetical protein [Bacteroidota bacterium]
MNIKNTIGFVALLGLFTIFSGCRKDPAILKVFVRSSSNQLIQGARVVVVGDQQSNPPTQNFVDTVYTNSSGFAIMDMDQYFDAYPNDGTTGYFDIYVEYNNKVASGNTRCRVQTTSVETIYLPN